MYYINKPNHRRPTPRDVTYMSCKARDALGSRSLNVTAVTRKLSNADYNDSSPDADSF